MASIEVFPAAFLASYSQSRVRRPGARAVIGLWSPLRSTCFMSVLLLTATRYDGMGQVSSQGKQVAASWPVPCSVAGSPHSCQWG
jgi:hypothetical protein